MIHDRDAARHLAAQAHHLCRASGREPGRDAIRWLSRGRWGRRTGWPVVPRLDSPWQDTISGERTGWRQRAAYLSGYEASPSIIRSAAAAGSAGWNSPSPGRTTGSAGWPPQASPPFGSTIPASLGTPSAVTSASHNRSGPRSAPTFLVATTSAASARMSPQVDAMLEVNLAALGSCIERCGNPPHEAWRQVGRHVSPRDEPPARQLLMLESDL